MSNFFASLFALCSNKQDNLMPTPLQDREEERIIDLEETKEEIYSFSSELLMPLDVKNMLIMLE